MNKRWFTLIEVMIAITVFAIGVLAVLRLLTSNLVMMDKTENRTIATFLAKEGIEMVYNIRDANIEKWLPWNCLLAPTISLDLYGQGDSDKACERYFSSGANDGDVLSLGLSATGYFFAEHKKLESSFPENFTTFGLVQKTMKVGEKEISRYTPGQSDETWSLQIFGRYVVFKAVKDGATILPLDSVLKVESHVLFSKWASTGEIVLESLIWKK